jgi:hypothetical protein
MLCCHLCSCHPLFCVWDMGYSEIDHSVNVTGVYHLTAYSKKMMYYEGKYKNIPDSKLKLNADSTYTITDAPDWLNNSWGTSSQKYFNKSGKWFLFCNNKNGCTMELEGIEAGNLLATKKNKINILLTVGDPDSCQGMVYEKE